MNTEGLSTIGEAADLADNLKAGLVVPLPWEIRHQGLEGCLTELRDMLRKVYVEGAGEDPWEGQPE